MNTRLIVIVNEDAGLQRVPTHPQTSRAQRFAPLHQEADRSRVVEQAGCFGLGRQADELLAARMPSRNQ
jgi:hypothetical protein